MTNHTPTPWEAQSFDDEENGVGVIGLRTDKNGVAYHSPTNGLVAWATLHPTEIEEKDSTRALANAAFICKAVNNHEALVKALIEIRRIANSAGNQRTIINRVYELATQASRLEFTAVSGTSKP